jgi:hypothetical protein
LIFINQHTTSLKKIKKRCTTTHPGQTSKKSLIDRKT